MDPELRQILEGLPPEAMTPSLIAFALFMGLLLFAGVGTSIALLVMASIHPPDWYSRQDEVRARPWTLTHVGIIAVSILFFRGLWAAALYFYPDAPWRESVIVHLWAGAAMLQGAGTFVILAIIGAKHFQWRQAFGNVLTSHPQAMWHGLVGYVAVFPIVVFFALVFRFLLSRYFGLPMEKQYVVSLFLAPETSAAIKATIVFFAVALAPLAEELMFRGVLLPALCKRIPTGWAICVVGLVFASLHLNPASFAPLFVLSVSFSIAYIYSRTLVVPIVMHTLFNSHSIVAMLVLQDKASFLGFSI